MATEATMAATTEAEDGRHARRQRNRDAVVDALLELYREGNLQPSSDEVAERAGLSARSLFRYFDDVDDLARAAITRQREQVRHLATLTITPDAPAADRIRELVAQRVRLFEAIGPVARVSRLRAPFRPVILGQLTQARAFLRRQVEQVMAPELAALSSRAPQVLAAADVLCSFESYELLRHDQGLSKPKTASVLTDALTVLFCPEEP
jgi:AcrR family transcriptional regulator